jgi:L-glyceraldehyde 3-phosphate reductase
MEFNPARYDTMTYRRCGRTGLRLPAISLGMWHNFGDKADHANCVAMMQTAFDLGVTHFDLANNYGPAPGSAETRVGKILREEFKNHRDELIISTKAGYYMWPGPYGEWGSKKYLVASLDQSLKRMGLDYVDIFYHHRPDPDTPVEETLEALDIIVRQGKALYAGVSSYRGAQFVQAAETARRRGWTPIVIHQPLYHMLERWVEHDLLAHTDAYGTGVIAFCPLAQGVLTSKYLDPTTPLPKDSRAADPDGFLQPGQVTPMIEKVRKLNEIAKRRGQSMAQMALSWVLRSESVTSALIGASRPAQITECVGALENLAFSEEELAEIDRIALG